MFVYHLLITHTARATWCRAVYIFGTMAKVSEQGAQIDFRQEQFESPWRQYGYITAYHVYFPPLDELISNEFIPSLFGGQISPSKRKLISLPVKYGGMGIPILTKLARKEYSTSVLVTSGCHESQ